MQVPVVAAHVMDWVSMTDPDAATLMEQIKEINVFKVFHREARVRSTHSTPREWWVWGNSQDIPRTTFTQLVTEAEKFFAKYQVSLHSCAMIS